MGEKNAHELADKIYDKYLSGKHGGENYGHLELKFCQGSQKQDIKMHWSDDTVDRVLIVTYPDSVFWSGEIAEYNFCKGGILAKAISIFEERMGFKETPDFAWLMIELKDSECRDKAEFCLKSIYRIDGSMPDIKGVDFEKGTYDKLVYEPDYMLGAVAAYLQCHFSENTEGRMLAELLGYQNSINKYRQLEEINNRDLIILSQLSKKAGILEEKLRWKPREKAFISGFTASSKAANYHASKKPKLDARNKRAIEAMDQHIQNGHTKSRAADLVINDGKYTKGKDSLLKYYRAYQK